MWCSASEVFLRWAHAHGLLCLSSLDTLDSQSEWEQEALQKNSSGILRGRATSSSLDSHMEVVCESGSVSRLFHQTRGLAFAGRSLSILQSGHHSPAGFALRTCKLSSFVCKSLKLRTQPVAVHHGNFFQWLLWSSKSVVEIIWTM